MKPMDDWDEELIAIAREVHTLATEQAKQKSIHKNGLITRKMATIQSQLKIEKMISRIKAFCEREFLLLPKEKALLHWSKIFLENVEKYYELKQKNLTKSLWIRLIRTRIVGPDHTPFSNFDNDDLIALSIRHSNLAKTEKYLGEAIVKKRGQKKDAIKRYQQLTIAQENRYSATTMQGRLGINLEHALRNPVINSIGKAVLQSSASIHSDDRYKHANDLESKYSQRSASVLAICRKYAINTQSDPNWAPSDKVIGRVEKVMKNLNKLEQSTEATYKEIISANFPTSHPKIVHNSSKKDKTVTPE